MDFCTDFTDVTLVSNDTSGDDDKDDEDDGVSSEDVNGVNQTFFDKV